MPFSPIRSQLDVPGSGYRGTGFPEIQLGHVSPKQATNDVESPSVATDVTERMERALAPMSEKPGHIGEARWNELQERLGEILSLASERKLSWLDSIKNALAIRYAREIVPGWYDDASAERAQLSRSHDLISKLAELDQCREAEHEYRTALIHRHVGALRREEPQTGTSAKEASWIEAKTTQHARMQEIQWVKAEIEKDPRMQELQQARMDAERVIRSLRTKIDRLLFAWDATSPRRSSRFDRSPPTVDEVLAYLLDVRSLLDTALEFKDGSLDMDPFFSRQEFEYGVIALAHALEISIHEAHEFVQHAKAVSGIRRTYVYEATSSYPHPRLPSDKTPSQ